MKFCIKCNGSGKILVKTNLSSYPGSFDYYPQNCSSCSGNGYITPNTKQIVSNK